MKIINSKSLMRFSSVGIKPDKEGYLLKRGKLNKSYHRRWCVLKGNLLFYYAKQDDKEPLGLVILEGCIIGVADIEGVYAYAFHINFPGSFNRTYTFSADTQEDLEAWMKSLSCAPYDYVRLIVSELKNQLTEVTKNCTKVNCDTKSDCTETLARNNSFCATCSNGQLCSSVLIERLNPFNAPNAADGIIGSCGMPTSSVSKVCTWEMLCLTTFDEMHQEIKRQIGEISVAASEGDPENRP